MNYLLDTCTLIWLTSEPTKLSKIAKSEIDKNSTSLMLSDVSVLESLS